MSIAVQLLSFGLSQIFDASRETILNLVVRHFTDHTQTLPKALKRANERAWQALRLALAGESLLAGVKDIFRDADVKAVRQDIRAFLVTQSTWQALEPSFRKACLGEIETAWQAGLLVADNISAQALAEQAQQFAPYAELADLMAGANQALTRMAADLKGAYPKLAQLLALPVKGPPLLVSAFVFFLRREIGTNQELANELTWDSLQRLCAAQAAAFTQLDNVLHLLGPKLNELLAGQQRIEEGVLNLQESLERLNQEQSQQSDEVRQLLQEVLWRLDQAHMERGEVRPQQSFSIRSEDERQAIKQLLQRFRRLSPEQQARFPELLNGLGKLQFGSGDNAAAERTFEEVAELVDDARARAEAHYNAYRAALETKDWTEAFPHIVQAAQLDPQRFAPFPLHTYEPQKILGAGGFGTAFLCFHRRLKKPRVVKAIHSIDLDRQLDTVFEEATLLQELRNPAIIEVYECNYADPDHDTRPYIVMEYFPGGSLDRYLEQHGPLPEPELRQLGSQLATAMQAAHNKGILHRDLKPDNILVRKVNSGWEVKIIDFGLALRRSTVETSVAAGSLHHTLLGQSMAGTLDYAPPEQMGKLLGVPPGPYSDVYAFGKLCCYALFQTTEPKRRHWDTVSNQLAELLEGCTEPDLQLRVSDFARVLTALNKLEQPQAQDLEKQRQKKLELQREGEAALAALIRTALDRQQGQLTKADNAAANELVKRFLLNGDRAKSIVSKVRKEWKQAAEATAVPKQETDSADAPGPERRTGLRYKLPLVTSGVLGAVWLFLFMLVGLAAEPGVNVIGIFIGGAIVFGGIGFLGGMLVRSLRGWLCVLAVAFTFALALKTNTSAHDVPTAGAVAMGTTLAWLLAIPIQTVMRLIRWLRGQ